MTESVVDLLNSIDTILSGYFIILFLSTVNNIIGKKSSPNHFQLLVKAAILSCVKANKNQLQNGSQVDDFWKEYKNTLNQWKKNNPKSTADTCNSLIELRKDILRYAPTCDNVDALIPRYDAIAEVSNIEVSMGDNSLNTSLFLLFLL